MTGIGRFQPPYHLSQGGYMIVEGGHPLCHVPIADEPLTPVLAKLPVFELPIDVRANQIGSEPIERHFRARQRQTISK